MPHIYKYLMFFYTHMLIYLYVGIGTLGEGEERDVMYQGYLLRLYKKHKGEDFYRR